MYNIAIVGPKKRITLELLEVLEDTNFSGEIYILDIKEIDASQEDMPTKIDSKTKDVLEDLQEDDQNSYHKIKFKGGYLEIRDYETFDFSLVDYICYFENKKYIKKILTAIKDTDIVLIDNSEYFMNDYSVPIIIPEINKHLILDNLDAKVITTPSAIVVQMLLPLYLLHKDLVIKRVVCSTYQSVSEAGNEGLSELFEQTRGIYYQKPVNNTKAHFTKQIAFNVIPHIGKFLDDGITAEEHNLSYQTKRILGDDINITSTCVQVPVFIGDAMSLNIEFENSTTEEKLRNILSDTDDIISIVDYRVSEGYVTPTEVVGENKIYISRIRKDETQKNTFNFWIVADNLRRGVALNILNIMNIRSALNKE